MVLKEKNDGTISVKNNNNKEEICTAKKYLILERPLKKTFPDACLVIQAKWRELLVVKK